MPEAATFTSYREVKTKVHAQLLAEMDLESLNKLQEDVAHARVAEAIRELHLPWCPALSFKQGGAGDDERGTAYARCGDVEAVERVQEFHSPWRILRRRGGHRVDDRRTGLPLELVHRPDRDAERLETNCKTVHLGVVRRHAA